ncbi:uncharacterized protein LOC129880770 isoform X2 [Solanum dulcamara]|uniref:uncharacterized protein LOC129880770 isoform X2 n=1 Tax=Solanum dulcamara TaxID=45834 RepID=UPI0024867846|nr:uncharacterized protein LOC129880770 isoform X2 [Solanum dulcamara]
MARNEEKAQSMLNRFITMKEEEKKKPKERRPYLASECRDLAEADKWRQQIMREIGRKVAEIQNEGLGEHRLRDLNDEINKLIREKVHWERRIIELGGPNYTKYSAKMTDLDGNIVDVPNPGGRGPGYRYFGAAKKLPGVRELFEKPPELRKRRTSPALYSLLRKQPRSFSPSQFAQVATFSSSCFFFLLQLLKHQLSTGTFQSSSSVHFFNSLLLSSSSSSSLLQFLSFSSVDSAVSRVLYFSSALFLYFWTLELLSTESLTVTAMSNLPIFFYFFFNSSIFISFIINLVLY